MNYVTEINAISPVTNEMTLFAGPHVPGTSFEEAQNYCETNGLGYCKVVGFLDETPEDETAKNPD